MTHTNTVMAVIYEIHPEIGSGAMLYVETVIKIGSYNEKLMGNTYVRIY
jgi:hypothetical protein